MMIGIAGQLDGIAALFSHALSRHYANTDTIVALSREASCGWHVDTWRLGSMTGERETRHMLHGLSLVYYFCLTPPVEGRTREGYGYDVALCDAMNFAHEAADKVRVVLVTRLFPDDGRPLGEAFSYWREVCDIFSENIRDLQIVQTAPVWSEFDGVMMGMFHYACHRRLPDQDVRFFNYMDPVTCGELIRQLLSLGSAENGVGDKQPVCFVEGETALTYHALIQCMKTESRKARRFGQGLANIVRPTHPAAKQDARLFEEALAFHSATEQSVQRDRQTTQKDPVFRACRDFVQEYYDTSVLHQAYTRLGTASRDECVRNAQEVATDVRHYVYRIAKAPKRSVADIAELFIQWLPRYFQRAVSLEKLNDTRRMCRLSRIPLAEFELEREAWNRCRLHIKWPWGVKVNANVQLVVTVTGTREKARELLIVCEDGPDSSWFIMIARGIMLAFGNYLRDYGVAD